MFLVVFVFLLLCLFVRKQDYLKNNERMCMKLLPDYRGVSLAKEQSINFGGGLQSMTDYLVVLCHHYYMPI